MSLATQRFAEGGDYDDQELNELEELLQEPRKEVSIRSQQNKTQHFSFLTGPPGVEANINTGINRYK